MDLATVRNVHHTIGLVHRLVYFVPEAADEYAALGLDPRAGYFASRAAPLGAVPDEVIVATFYNFHPRAVRAAMAGVWAKVTPAQMQAARFRVVRRALDRVGVSIADAALAEAQAIVDPVVAGLDLAGKALAAANAAVALPDDPLLALWQQLAVVREWRGDVHIAALVAHELGPCECMVVEVGVGKFPMSIARATRRWDDVEWATAVERLTTRGWTNPDGSMTDHGTAERERIEVLTDTLCAPIWASVGDEGAHRLAEIVAPIHDAMQAAGTYGALR
jgi:hypothetical protein